MGARAQVTKRSKSGVPSGLVVVLTFWCGWHAGTILHLHLGVHLPSGVCLHRNRHRRTRWWD